jgi:fatty-acyl-CoA synthase
MPLRAETLGAMWKDVVAAHPDRPALISTHQDIRWTYRELDDQVEQCARALLASHVAKKDRVGIWSPNNAEWVVLQLATARVGAILVNVNPSYRRSELEYALEQSGCSLLLHAASFKGADYAEILEGVAAQGVRERVVIDDGWNALLERGDGVAPDALGAREAELDFDDPINIQYTSGTTGYPKGATLSHHNLLNNGFFIGEVLGYTERDRVCLPVPFYHCFGMVLGNLAIVSHGACIVLPGEAFEPRSVLRTVEAEQCTSLYGVPTMFIAELNLADFSQFDVSSLRTGIMAGAPCPIEVMKRVRTEMHMNEVTICYGMTETSPVSTQTRRDCPLGLQVSTVGTVHPHVELKIVDPATGRIARRGEPGELCTRGYSVMLGYWNDETATREAIDSARWMHTGDLAVMDSEGYVTIVGRLKDMIIRGGENIYPREIEELLYGHPDVADVQVIGIPDERLGEVVCAWVIRKDGSDVTEEEIREFCRERISRFKVPASVRFVDAFPLTVTGKVQKYKMREFEMRERGTAQPAGVRPV